MKYEAFDGVFDRPGVFVRSLLVRSDGGALVTSSGTEPAYKERTLIPAFETDDELEAIIAPWSHHEYYRDVLMTCLRGASRTWTQRAVMTSGEIRVAVASPVAAREMAAALVLRVFARAAKNYWTSQAPQFDAINRTAYAANARWFAVFGLHSDGVSPELRSAFAALYRHLTGGERPENLVYDEPTYVRFREALYGTPEAFFDGVYKEFVNLS